MYVYTYNQDNDEKRFLRRIQIKDINQWKHAMRQVFTGSIINKVIDNTCCVEIKEIRVEINRILLSAGK